MDVLPEIHGRKGWAYFNRQGLIVVQNVAIWDNGPSPFHHGLVRVEKSDKWGLVKFDGTIAVPLNYDGIYEPDEHGRWLACIGCRTVSDGEHSSSVGGKWFWLNRSGQQVAKATDPATPKH